MEKIDIIVKNEIENGLNHLPVILYFELFNSALFLCEKLTNGALYDSTHESLNDIEIKIIDLKNKLKESGKIARQITELLKEEKDIQKKLDEENYAQKIAEKDKLDINISELKLKQELIDKFNPQALESTIESKEKELHNRYTDFLRILNKSNDYLQEIEQNFDENPAIIQLKKNKEHIERRQFDVLEILNDDLGQLEEINDHLKTSREQYNELVVKLRNAQEKLREIDETHIQNVAIWNAHFLANVSLQKSFSEQGYDSEELQTLTRDIEEKLALYDNELKFIVSARDQLSIQEISERNKV